MSREAFNISSVNPNDSVGGGGCVCSEGKVEDCHGPYAVFYATEMDNNLSPHVVIGEPCLRRALARIDAGEALAAGEDDSIPGAEEVAETWDDGSETRPGTVYPIPEDDGIPVV